MPQFVEDCVKKIHGVNKRTGKPYTQSDKYAICNAAWNRKQKKASIDEVEFIDYDEDILAAEEMMDKKMDECHRRMMKSGKAKNMQEAHDLCQKYLSKAEYDGNRLEFILDLEIARKFKEEI